MNTYGLTAYKGDKPYIFVSYAHKDADVVLPLIKVLQEAGYRIWFDLGIELGTEWSNTIAYHLRDCSAFLFFTSQNSVKSENCLDEVAYAKSHNKAAVLVYLEEDVTLPAGTEMQTARFQRMYVNRQANMKEFLEGFENADIFDSCRGEATTGYTKSTSEAIPRVKPQANNTKPSYVPPVQPNYQSQPNYQPNYQPSNNYQPNYQPRTNYQPNYQPQPNYYSQDANYMRYQWPIKNKVLAALLAIFLGAFGAHKFYLGKPVQGVVRLIFCWAYIPGILGIIEGLSILCSSDEKFENKYKCRVG